MLIRIAMYDGMHMELDALKTAENLIECRDGQENWFRQVLQHVGKQTRLHVKSTEPNTEPLSPWCW